MDKSTPSVAPFKNQQAPPPPPPPSSSSFTSFPILAITILGILTTAILLISYATNAVNCCLSWRRTGLLPRRARPSSPSAPILRHTIGVEHRGLEPAVIRAIPILTFTKASAAIGPGGECAVCLNDFQEQEKLRLLPSCSHTFHIDCIDTWLHANSNCPLCRTEITSIMPFPFDLSLNPFSPEQPKEVPNDRTKGCFRKVGSMGDEYINVREHTKDELFCVQPIRRSLSLDSCSDRQLYLSVQDILRQKYEGNSSSGDSGSSDSGNAGRMWRPFFSFGNGRGSRSAVLPL